MTWDFHIMRFGGLLAWELPEACNFSSLYSLAHSILSGSGLRVRWILKFVFSLVNWIFIHVTYICLSSASLYLSHVVEHCFSSVFYVDKMKQSQSVFCFIIWVMDYAHRQAEEPVAKSERGPCLPLFCAQYIKFFKHGLQHWGLQRLVWSWFGIHFSECTTFFCHFQKFIRRTPVQWVWSLLFPEWPVTFFFTLLVLLIDYLGLKIHSHCVSRFLTSLHHCCMHFLT